jgi:hypothetical protein
LYGLDPKNKINKNNLPYLETGILNIINTLNALKDHNAMDMAEW